MRLPSGDTLPDFKVFETREFLAALNGLQPPDVKWVRRKLEGQILPQLRGEPFFGANIKKLRGYSPDTWRYRLGRFRLFYVVDEAQGIIFLLTVDQRKDAYK